MRVLVCNRGDSASVNIRDHLLETGDWQEAGVFRGHTLYQRAYDVMVQVDGPVIHDEDLGEELARFEWPIHAVWFLSRHRAASGNPSLTVHPIGNHGSAEYGGRSGTLVPAACRDMGALLRRLLVHRDLRGLPHDVTYEATHHGPYLDLPSLFVEIGSDETYYEDGPSGEALAAAVTDVLDGEGATEAPIVLGIGGGHYVPQQTRRGLDPESPVDFGHFVPGYALDPDDPEGATEILRRAWAATPNVAAAYVHKKGLKGPQRQIVRDWAAADGIELV